MKLSWSWGWAWQKYQDSSQKCSSWKYRDKRGGWLGTKLFGNESKLENYEKIQWFRSALVWNIQILVSVLKLGQLRGGHNPIILRLFCSQTPMQGCWFKSSSWHWIFISALVWNALSFVNSTHKFHMVTGKLSENFRLS